MKKSSKTKELNEIEPSEAKRDKIKTHALDLFLKNHCNTD